jgi:hypothetical protein
MHRPVSSLTAASLVVAAACAGGEPVTVEPQVTVVDGVREVFNPAPQWGANDGWRVAGEPRLTLGVEVGEPHEMFTNPGAVRLPDGRFVVADRGANELRYFAVDGSYLYTRGGPGEGPGEFRFILDVWSRSDGGLLVSDTRLRRMTALDGAGALEATFSLQSHQMEYGPARVIDVFADGSLLTQATKRPFPQAPAGQIEWQMMGLFVHDSDGTDPRHIIDLPYIERSGGDMDMAFYAEGHVVADPEGRIMFSDGRSFDVSTYGLDGALRQRFRRAGRPLAITEADRQAWIDKSRTNIEQYGGDPEAEARVARMSFPEFIPNVAGMMRDGIGNVWVRRYLGVKYAWVIFYESHQAFRPDESVWDVFTADGIWLGAVELPPDGDVLQIGEDWLLTRGESATGVQQILLHDLIKP